jgi:hypothetical protein
VTGPSHPSGLRATHYFRYEHLLMLKDAGFSDVVLPGDSANVEPTDTRPFVVYIAKRGG